MTLERSKFIMSATTQIKLGVLVIKKAPTNVEA